MKLDLDIQTYIKQARNSKQTVQEIAKSIGKSERTVGRYLAHMGLTESGRLDLPVETVRDLYLGGMTCNEIAIMFGVSHAAVTSRLAKVGIVPNRAENIRKHFQKSYDERWSEAEALLSSGKSFSDTCAAVHMRPENLRWLMEKNHWHQPVGAGYEKLIAAFDELISSTTNAKRRSAAVKYRTGVEAYFASHHNIPTASQLSRFMGLSVQTVASWLKQNGMSHLMGVGKQIWTDFSLGRHK